MTSLAARLGETQHVSVLMRRLIDLAFPRLLVEVYAVSFQRIALFLGLVT
jgi:hypothetical protein